MTRFAKLGILLVALVLSLPTTFVARQKQPEPQKPERTRIGIAPVRNLTSEIISPHILALEIRQELMTKHTDAELLAGETRDELEEDAKKKECDYILYADVVLMRQVTRGARVAGAERADEPDPIYESSGTFVGQLRVRMVKLGTSRPRFDQKIHGAGGGVTAQDAALNLTHSIRRLVLSALGVK
jgi:hypothetical protein